MAMNPLLIAGALAAGYFVFVKPTQDRKKQAATSSGNGGTAPPAPSKPYIVTGADCTWEVPFAWWSEVATPKFAQLIKDNVAGLTGQAAAEMAKNFNSHDMARALLMGELPQDCAIPLTLSPNSTPSTTKEQNQVALFKYVKERVEGGLLNFINSQGTVVQLTAS